MPLISEQGQKSSVIVIHKDRIIAEKYDTGFNKDSKIGLVDDQSITSTILEYWKKGKI
jgi:hypothetical protein